MKNYNKLMPLVASTILLFFSLTLNSQDVYKKVETNKSLLLVLDSLDKIKMNYGVVSPQYRAELCASLPHFFEVDKVEDAHSLSDDYFRRLEVDAKSWLENKDVSPELYASLLCFEYQQMYYAYESCSDTLYALSTIRKSVEPFKRIDLHNQDYANALFNMGVAENNLNGHTTSMREMEIYESAICEYDLANAADSIFIEKLSYVRTVASIILSNCTSNQIQNYSNAVRDAYQCISMWEHCLEIFNKHLGEDVVNDLLLEEAEKSCLETSKLSVIYEYGTKMHYIEPYWESLNYLSTQLSRISFMIRDREVYNAIEQMHKVISCIGDKEKIIAEFSYQVATELKMWDYKLEAKDLFENLYYVGSLERALYGNKAYSKDYDNSFSLSNFHYENVRTYLALIYDKLNTSNWASRLSIELRNASINNYKNRYNYVKDRISLSRICELDNNFDEAIKLLQNAEEAMITLDETGVQSGYEPDLQLAVVNNLGDVFYHKNDMNNAVKYFEKAAKLGSITAIANLGCCYYFQGNYLKAIENLEIARQHFSKDNSGMLQASYVAMGENEKAEDEGYSCLKDLRESDLQLLFKMFQNERMAYPFVDPYTSLYVQYSRTYGKLCYDSQLYSKGIELHCEQTIRNALRCHKNLYAEYRALFDTKQIDKDFSVNYRAILGKLYNQIEKDGGLKEYDINWRDVQSNLDKGELAIEFFCYHDLGDSKEKYAAVFVKDNGEPMIVKLPSEEIYQDFLSHKDAGYRSLAISSKLFNSIFNQILPFMEKGKTIYFAPDGLLRLINIECLYTSEGNDAVLSNRLYNFKRVSSTRELCTKNNNEAIIKNALLYGNLQYDMSKSEIDSVHKESNLSIDKDIQSSTINLRGGGGMVTFLTIPLPGTEREINDISDLMKSRKVTVDVLKGAEGTEESFKSVSSSSPTILHFATHGFYLTKSLSSYETFYENRNEGFDDNPMNRSGIIFSGAKKALSGDAMDGVDDGVLLATEVASMDLSNTNLVVLSACETGLGDVWHGEIYGLQRGFKLAGVQTIVMSLWNVDDCATVEFMTTFYKNLLSGKTKQTSFNNARTYLYNKYINRPDYWAAFIMID